MTDPRSFRDATDSPSTFPRRREPPPLERAQLVWRRAVELVDPTEPHDLVAAAIELLRTADHGPATMAHALALGRSRLRDHPDDDVARRAAGVLAGAIAFLGARPALGDVEPGAPIMNRN